MRVNIQQLVISPKVLGVLLRDLRKQKGLTQTELGRKVGLDQKKVSLMENGNPNMRVDSLFRLLSSLDYGLVVAPKVVDRASEMDDW
jgi:HTH-type transcriptional regulator/antitoxin HipB